MRRALCTILVALLVALALPAGAQVPTWTPSAPSGGGGSAVWTYGSCTRVDDNTFSVADNSANLAAFRVGIPVRAADTIGTWRYALITTVTDAGATLTIDLVGAPFTAAFDAYCQYGLASLVLETQFTDPGQFADPPADPTLLSNDLLWEVNPSSTVTRYLVRVCAMSRTDDTGANQPACTPYVNGVASSTAITIADDAWYCTTSATTDAAQYDLLYGESFEWGCDASGSNDDSSNASVVFTWILEG